MKVIVRFIKSSLLRFILAAITSTVSGFSLASIIYLINEGIETEMADTAYLIPRFFGAIFLYTASSITSTYLISYLSQNLVQELRLTLSNKILKTSFHKLEYQTKRLFTILTDDINTISGTVNKLPAVMTGLATVAGCFLYMLYISWQLFSIFLGVFTITFILYRLPLNSFGERMRQARSHQNELFGYFEGLIYGLKELSLNKGQRMIYTKEIIEPLTEAQKQQNIKGKTTMEVFTRWGEIILLLGIGSILYTIHKYHISDYDTLQQFLVVALLTISPLSRITGFLPDLKRIDVALEQVLKAGLNLEKETTFISKSDHQFPANEKPILSLNQVTYSYYQEDEEKFFELGPISLDIKQGEITYLIGGNGSGKSTLAKVLCGLYPSQSGHISFFGQKITEENVEDFRNQFNVIFADFYLFKDVLHLDQKVIDEKAEEYLKLLELDKKVHIKNKQLTTTSLSTGQRKRLALLISYLEDKPFYLFDEWAAGLDPHYKRVFYKKLIPDLQKRGKTVFVITHDESYFDGADNIIMLKEGKLLESHLLHDQLKEFFK